MHFTPSLSSHLSQLPFQSFDWLICFTRAHAPPPPPLTVLLFVAMGDQDVGGLLQPQAEELHLLFAVLVDFKNLVFESSSVDVVFKDIDPVRLGNPLRNKTKKQQLN